MNPKIGYDDNLIRDLTKRFNRELAILKPLIEALNEMAKSTKEKEAEENDGNGEES